MYLCNLIKFFLHISFYRSYQAIYQVTSLNCIDQVGSGLQTCTEIVYCIVQEEWVGNNDLIVNFLDPKSHDLCVIWSPKDLTSFSKSDYILAWKELCNDHKYQFLDLYSIATWCRRSLIFQTMYYVMVQIVLNIKSLLCQVAKI